MIVNAVWLPLRVFERLARFARSACNVRVLRAGITVELENVQHIIKLSVGVAADCHPGALGGSVGSLVGDTQVD